MRIGVVFPQTELGGDAGATHLSVNTMGAGLKTIDDHLTALVTAAEAAKTISG